MRVGFFSLPRDAVETEEHNERDKGGGWRMTGLLREGQQGGAGGCRGVGATAGVGQ